MKFEIHSFKVDILMNSSSLNKGDNTIFNIKVEKQENEGVGTIAGEKNRMNHNTGMVNRRTGTEPDQQNQT
ncbi:hypothetical protein JOC95_003427 [Bacillus tianshenii]|uniref:Uncharacterized protein n=1 Tax=Sutcliffiella tianshenii TaxID=1463404 RepID=A0ABS2P4K9_9BACI|nr:hypothetical protein [Bacillus tianshenii]MBM7621538.1 hypothetical protein [Bacillus tianshenii]